MYHMPDSLLKSARDVALDQAQNPGIKNDLKGIQLIDLRGDSPDLAYEGTYEDRLRERGEDFIAGVKLMQAHLGLDERKKHMLEEAIQRAKTAFDKALLEAKSLPPQKGKNTTLTEQQDQARLHALSALCTDLQIAIKMSAGVSSQDAYLDLQDAANFVNWKRPREAVATISETQNEDGEKFTIIQLEVPTVHVTDALLKEYQAIFTDKPPKWFHDLPLWHQSCMKEHFKELENASDPKQALKNAFKTMPSTIRKYPGIANYSEHVHIILDEQGEIISETHRSHSSVVAPVQMEKVQKDSLTKLTADNIEQIIEQQLEIKINQYIERWGPPPAGQPLYMPVALQTLLSHTRLLDKQLGDEKAMIKKVEAGAKKLMAEKYKGPVDIKGYQVKVDIVTSNNPINVFRYMKAGRKGLKLLETQDKIRRANLKKYVDVVEKRLQSIVKSLDLPPGIQSLNLPEKPHKADLNKLKNQITAIVNSVKEKDSQKGQQLNLALQALYQLIRTVKENRPSDKKYNDPLFRASLEQIIIDALGGITTGSCKSGKDRKGTEVVHTDALLEYFVCYGKILPFDAKEDSPERQHFVDIFVRKLLENHLGRNAASNARGCDGLKALDVNLPFDVLEKMKSLKNEKDKEFMHRNEQNSDLNRRPDDANPELVARLFVEGWSAVKAVKKGKQRAKKAKKGMKSLEKETVTMFDKKADVKRVTTLLSEAYQKKQLEKEQQQRQAKTTVSQLMRRAKTTAMQSPRTSKQHTPTGTPSSPEPSVLRRQSPHTAPARSRRPSHSTSATLLRRPAPSSRPTPTSTAVPTTHSSMKHNKVLPRDELLTFLKHFKQEKPDIPLTISNETNTNEPLTAVIANNIKTTWHDEADRQEIKFEQTGNDLTAFEQAASCGLASLWNAGITEIDSVYGSVPQQKILLKLCDQLNITVLNQSPEVSQSSGPGFSP